MMYVVEIPHQRPASCWTAIDEADFCSRVADASKGCGDTPVAATFDAWRDYLASDLHTLHVFTTDAAALAALEDDTFDHHQGARARAALEDKLRLYGVIAEMEGDD